MQNPHRDRLLIKRNHYQQVSNLNGDKSSHTDVQNNHASVEKFLIMRTIMNPNCDWKIRNLSTQSELFKFNGNRSYSYYISVLSVKSNSYKHMQEIKFQFHIRPCHLMGTLLEHAQLTNMWPAFNKVVMTRIIWLLETRSHSLPFKLCSDIRIILML